VNETLRTVDGRSVLHMERRFAHPPQKVWRAITEPAHLTQWFPSDVAVDLRVGGEIRFDFRAGEGPSLTGTVTELDPPRVIAYTWGKDLLHFELRPDGGGCLLVFTHTFDDRAGAASFASGWQVCLAGLGNVLDGEPVESPTDMAALHEEYVEAFGLAEGTSEDTADGWRVRFERQLTRPAEAVWTLLAPGPVAVGDPAPVTHPRVPAGAVTAVEAPRLLEYDWLHDGQPAGRVRWELTTGTGHGARLIVTQTGPRELAGARSAALDAWHEQIERLAKRLLA